MHKLLWSLPDDSDGRPCFYRRIFYGAMQIVLLLLLLLLLLLIIINNNNNNNNNNKFHCKTIFYVDTKCSRIQQQSSDHMQHSSVLMSVLMMKQMRLGCTATTDSRHHP